MKANSLLTNRNLRHNSHGEGLKKFQKKYRSIVMAEFINPPVDGWQTGYIVQKTPKAHYFIPIRQEYCRSTKSYITKTDEYVACILYTRYLNIEINEIWNIAMGITKAPCTIEILRRMWELFEDIPIDEEEDIDLDFLLWEKGTDRYEIWHWFDELCPHGLAKDIMYYDDEEK